MKNNNNNRNYTENNTLYKTIFKGEEITETYHNLINITQGYLSEKFQKIESTILINPDEN